MFSSITKPHFLQTTSPIPFAIFVEPHSGHLILIIELKKLNFLNIILFENIFFKNYTLLYELRNIYIRFK